MGVWGWDGRCKRLVIAARWWRTIVMMEMKSTFVHIVSFQKQSWEGRIGVYDITGVLFTRIPGEFLVIPICLVRYGSLF